MRRTQTISFNEFMSSGCKKEKNKLKANRLIRKIGTSVTVPLVIAQPVFATSHEAVTVGAKEWMSEQTLSAIAHLLDPVVDILVALSFPVASVVIVGACFLFMFGKAERAWTMIQNAGLGYILIQVSPLILNVLKQVGEAV
ncbi:hypothetical protein [Bacillus sp. SM2101]|uniref:hypothetical protein n=1 Tax=Bacillus sp. SM2101 TaxID=2805366 RepID=UPI001BDF2008|nr:hypothetical protein [Bacillus sp. SM2101]